MNQVSIFVFNKVVLIVVSNINRHVLEGANHWACVKLVGSSTLRAHITEPGLSLNLNRNRLPSHVCHYLGVFLYRAYFGLNGNTAVFGIVRSIFQKGSFGHKHVFTMSKGANRVEVGHYGMALDRERVVRLVSGAGINHGNGANVALRGHIIETKRAQLWERLVCVNVNEINLGTLLLVKNIVVV